MHGPCQNEKCYVPVMITVMVISPMIIFFQVYLKCPELNRNSEAVLDISVS
jgi:hypothetical protein